MNLIFTSQSDIKNTAVCFYYFLKEELLVRFEVFNIKGICVAEINNGWQTPGEYTVYWSLKDLPSGIYLIRFNAGEESIVQKATLLNKAPELQPSKRS